MFYEDNWVSSFQLGLATDASDLGYGGVFGTKWYMQSFTPAQARLSIASRELYAIVVACVIWGPLLSSYLVRFQCDNLAVVSCVNNGSSKCPLIMGLIRKLFFIAATHDFDVRLSHIPGVDNVGPDLLSRLRLADFRKQYPEADRVGACVPSLW